MLVKQEIIAAKGHTEVIDDRIELTCMDTGMTEGKHCSVCHDVLVVQTSIPATGVHSYGNDGRCTVCQAIKLVSTEGLKYTLNGDGVSYSVTGIGMATATDIVIADVYEGLPVTSIGDSAFSGCTSLTSITYEGTTIEWYSIAKEYSWDFATPAFTIHCTDGDITK